MGRPVSGNRSELLCRVLDSSGLTTGADNVDVVDKGLVAGSGLAVDVVDRTVERVDHVVAVAGVDRVVVTRRVDGDVVRTAATRDVDRTVCCEGRKAARVVAPGRAKGRTQIRVRRVHPDRPDR